MTRSPTRTAGAPTAGTTTDTSTLPLADASPAVAGSSSLAAPRNHVHGRIHWTATDLNYLAMTVDGALCSGNVAPTAGLLQLARLHLPYGGSVTNVHLQVTTAGTSLTTGRNFAGLYTAAGVLVASTADMTSPWGTGGTGEKVMALAGGPYVCAAGDYYVGWFANNSSGSNPSFLRQGSTPVVNGRLAAPNLRFATADTGLTTALPSTFGTQTAASNGWWAALS